MYGVGAMCETCMGLGQCVTCGGNIVPLKPGNQGEFLAPWLEAAGMCASHWTHVPPQACALALWCLWMAADCFAGVLVAGVACGGQPTWRAPPWPSVWRLLYSTTKISALLLWPTIPGSGCRLEATPFELISIIPLGLECFRSYSYN